MKVLDAKIDWYLGWGNEPRLGILVDRVPKVKYTRIKTKGGNWIYFGEKEGYVEFFYHVPKDETGFGGRTFSVTMKNNKIVFVKGPWSSGSYAMNQYSEFPSSAECSITENPGVMERGHTFGAGHITVELAKKVMKKFFPKINYSYGKTDIGIEFLIDKKEKEAYWLAKYDWMLTRHAFEERREGTIHKCYPKCKEWK